MPDLVSGTRIRAADFPVAVFTQDETDYTGISSTSYTFGAADVTFTAPTSGRVLVSVTAGAIPSSGNRVFVAPEVYEGVSTSDDQVLPPNAPLRGVIIGFVSRITIWSRATLLEGLTPEATHYARAVYRVDGGTTNDLFLHNISVMPVP